jgi:alpha-L-fucosidase
MVQSSLRPPCAGEPVSATYGSQGRTLIIVARGIGPTFAGAVPALLTDGVDWYSAELEIDGGQAIAYAVNGYADRNTAERDAASRR